jgi:hypothetical protein
MLAATRLPAPPRPPLTSACRPGAAIDWQQVHSDARLITTKVVVNFLSTLTDLTKVKLNPVIASDSIVLMLRCALVLATASC